MLRRLRCAWRGWHRRPKTKGADALWEKGLPVRCLDCDARLWPRRQIEGEVRFR